MGLALASALLNAGHRVTVWNRTAERYARLVERGAEAAESVADAVGAGDLVVVCLLDYPTTQDVFAADGTAEALAGRTLLQFSFSNGSEAAAMESWVRKHRGDYLHGQIKAYPREVGTPEARLNYSGSESTFQTFRETLEALGEPVYLGSDVAAAAAVSNTSAILSVCIVVAFFEAAAYAVANGAQLDSVLAGVPTALRLAEATIEYSARQIAADDFCGDQASIYTHANAFATMVNAMADGRREPRIARAVLDYIQDARAKQQGPMEIAAIYKVIAHSL